LVLLFGGDDYWGRRRGFGSAYRSAACGIFALNGTAAGAGTLLVHHPPQESYMDREHVKGAADKAKGAIKDAAGKVTGDKELQTEGKLDKAKGDAHNLAGDLKDAVRKGKE
jgi:uncharacterized protein YjbJ (UPF0337 family)